MNAGCTSTSDSFRALPASIPSGLVVLHGNRLELLCEAVLQCFDRWPLAPLEDDVVLVQSNGAGEWFKATQAGARGICAGTRVELPGRFAWRLYAAVLGRGALPSLSPLDKGPATWRLLRLLPALMTQPVFAPLAAFVSQDGGDRLYQLACRLADMFDQYQIHRSDWLELWANGVDAIDDAKGVRRPLPAGQEWQSALWRALLGELDAGSMQSVRIRVHRAVLARLRAGGPFAAPLPRRVTLFGASALPASTLALLVELGRHAQVIVAVPNPCRYHWADIIDGRELLRDARRRHALRAERDLAVVPLASMHVHAHPLLAAWGRQGRDFMRQLDAFDEGDAAQQRFGLPRIDLFDGDGDDEGGGAPLSLLAQVQGAVRDLRPLQEHTRAEVAEDDRSIVFQIAHGPQREVEILHDQLLELLAQPPGTGRAALRPRDIVVMVPDIDAFAPHVRAVFGQYSRGDARHIPYDVVDLGGRAAVPLLAAVEWLLGIDRHRVGASEVRDLLDVPAVAARFGLDEADRPRLARWIQESGVRWGLNAAQRASLGLGACGDANTWEAGMRRMLLGYASRVPWAGIDPFDEIGGLDAALVGVLAAVLDRLEHWRVQVAQPASPDAWAQRARCLLQDWIVPTDTREREAMVAIDTALVTWLGACECAGFEAPVALSVFREAWLEGLGAMGASARFLAGGVTFCSLLPLRAVPFEVVCLLGMNEGDYPRNAPRSDLDLMAQPGMARPGDRARRDDDRYLMLEAVLSARRALSVSWSGRSARDNSVLPPSVLVAQLRDYLAAGWSGAGAFGQPDAGEVLLRQRTVHHPMQPFSRRYFDGTGLRTYAREWRAAHAGPGLVASASLPFDATGRLLDVQRLAGFLRNPVRAFFRDRLGVTFDADTPGEDDEPFAVDGLTHASILRSLIGELAQAEDPGADVQQRLRRLRRSGQLPLGGPGRRALARFEEQVRMMLDAWGSRVANLGPPGERVPLRLEFGEVLFEDWLGGLRGDPAIWIDLRASAMLSAGKHRQAPPLARADKLIEDWVRMLAARSCGHDFVVCVVGIDGVVELPGIAPDDARARLDAVIEAWRAGMERPLPWSARTAIAAVENGNPARCFDGGSAASFWDAQDPYLSRIYPDFAALTADGTFEHHAQRLFGPLCAWARNDARVMRHAAPRPVEDVDD